MVDPLACAPFATLCVPPGQALRKQVVAGLPPGGRRFLIQIPSLPAPPTLPDSPRPITAP